MLKIKVGGVEEHFNTPWFQLSEGDQLKDLGIDLDWVSCPGGTGEMTRLLREEEIDIAVLLTEGIIADIARGNPARILKVFVQSKLEWGIHTSAEVDLTDLSDNTDLRYAISKSGSGSHLMAMLNAKQKGMSPGVMDFREVGSLQGALKAFESKSVDVFLWERFTTEPFCDSGQLRRIDSIVTPWPCFVIALNPTFYAENKEKVDVLLDQVFHQASTLKKNPESTGVIADRFNLSSVRVQKWFDRVEWGSGQNLSFDDVTKVTEALKSMDADGRMVMPSSDFLLKS